MRRAVTVTGLFFIGLLAAFLSGCGAGMAGMGGGCGMMGGHAGHDASAAQAESAICPVCGTRVAVDEGTPRATYRDTLYYFVSEEHERRFLAEPERYLSEAAPAPSAPAEDHQHH